jgi:CheY-like chemotaxis protein
MQPCVILLDLMMPVMDGWQFRREQVRSPELAEIPVIVVSAAGRDRIAEIDADAYLTKPVDLEQLLERVSHYCCQ